MINGKSDGSFTFERFSPDKDFNDSAFYLSLLLSKHGSFDKGLSRTQFSECFQKSAERTGILLFTSICMVGETNLICNHDYDSGKINFSLNKSIVSKIYDLNPLVKHRFNVIDSVVEEIIWNLYRSGVKEFHLFLERKNDENEKITIDLGPKSGSEGSGNEPMKLTLSSADFIRTNIENFYSDDARYEWTFKEIKERKDTFGWSQDNVDWDRKKNDSLVPPPSFLTFREFTDGVEGSVFLTIKDKGILKYNDQDDLQKVVSSNLKNSFQVYADDKKGYFNNHDGVLALSICCGTRFSHADIGSAHEPHIGDELLGVFMTLLIDERFIEKLKVVSENIYLSSGTIKYILLQNLAREKSYNQQQDRREIEKQAQMLRLLEKPLKSLTEVLNKTQEDTQKLRSILYDPHKTLFSIAPLVEKYFSKGEGCEYGRVRWKGMHTINGIRTEKEKRDAAAMLAAIICRIYGCEPEGSEGEMELYKGAAESLMSKDPAYSELRNTLASIVHDGDFGQVVDVLRIQLLGLPDSNAPVCVITNLLDRLKAAVFTPFKYRGVSNFLPLALILSDYGYNKKITLVVESHNSKPKPELELELQQFLAGECFAECLFPSDSLLVLRYSNILSLISGVLGYMQDESGQISSVCLKRIFDKGILKSGRLSINFNKNLFILSEMEETFNLMTTASKNRMSMIQGNFRKPFIDFATSVEGANIKIESKYFADSDSALWEISGSGAKMTLQLMANQIYIEVVKDEEWSSKI